MKILHIADKRNPQRRPIPRATRGSQNFRLLCREWIPGSPVSCHLMCMSHRWLVNGWQQALCAATCPEGVSW